MDVMDTPNDSRKYLEWLYKKTMRTTTAAREVLSTGAPKVLRRHFVCYDHHFCDMPELAFVNHIVMGIIAMIVCLVGVLANTILIPVFNMVGIKSSATVYMTGIAVCDTISLILIVLMVVVKNLPSTFAGQLRMHQTFTGYLLGFGLPVKELVELLSIWLVIALLIDRFLYRIKIASGNHMSRRSHCVKLLLILMILLAFYTVPKFLRYKLVETVNGNNTMLVRVMFTQVAHSSAYQTTMFWLKLPLEIVIPYVFMFVMVVILGHSVWSKKTAFQYNCPSRMVSRDKIDIREQSNTKAVLFIGILMLCFKLPRLALHFVSTQPIVDQLMYLRLHIASDFLDLFSLWLKPFVYLAFCRHLRIVCLDMLCLFVRPGKTREIVLAGGLGATVTVEKGQGSSQPVHRSATTMTLISVDERRRNDTASAALKRCDTEDIKEAIARRAAHESQVTCQVAGSSSDSSCTTSGALNVGGPGEDAQGSNESVKPLFNVSNEEDNFYIKS